MPTPPNTNKMELLTTDTKITNTSMVLSSDVSILTIVIIAEVIVIITMTTDETIITIATTTTMIIITTNTIIKVLNNTLAGVHKKEQNTIIYNQLGVTVHKIITNSKSTATIMKKVMGTTSELTWI